MGVYIPIAVVAVVIIALIVWVISASNRFKVLLVKMSEADSGIDVALTKRYDMLTKLIDVVKSFAKRETDVIETLVRLRSGMDITEKAEVSRKMDEVSKKIRVIAETYPALRSSENYKQLQDAILDAEDHLQAARQVYNTNVSSFNQAIVQFPASIIASSAQYKPIAFFEAEAVKRTDVNINLNYRGGLNEQDIP